MMSIRRINLACAAAAAIFAVGAVAAVAGGWWLPYDVRLLSGRAPSIAAAPPPAASVARLTMEDFEPFLDGALGRPAPAPVVAAQPAVVEEPTSQPAPEIPALQLLGTITEADHSYAVFQTPQGVELKRVGESIADTRVVEISEGAAVVRDGGGQSVTMRVPDPPSPPG